MAGISRLAEVVDRATFPALGVWNKRIFANVRAKRLFGGSLDAGVADDVLFAFAQARETKTIVAFEAGGLSARMVPLLGLDGESDTAVVLIGNGIEHLPNLYADLSGGNSLWFSVVQLLPEIVLTVRPRRGAIDFWNHSWTAYTGHKRAELGTVLQAIHPSDRRAFEQLWRRTIVQEQGSTIDVRLVDAAGFARWHRLRTVPIAGKQARIVKWVFTFSDVDDVVEARLAVERSQKRIEVLAEAGRALQASLDTRSVADTACRFLVKRFCDEAVVALDAADQQILVGSPWASPLMAGAPTLIRLHNSTSWQYFCPSDPGSPTAHVVSIPIRAHRHGLGTLLLGFRSHEAHVEPEDFELYTAFADRLGLAIDNARLYANERRVAAALQSTLLPRKLPGFDGFVMDAAYLPGNDEDRIGGDWYDAFELRDGRIALSIGDVAGHGIQASAVMGTLRQTIRTAALDDASPNRVLALANLAAYGSETGLATAFFAAIDPIEMTIEYATAGHPAPFVVWEDRDVRQLPCGGMALGILEDLNVDVSRSKLPRNGALMLYTDGMIEYSHDLFAGTESLRGALLQWYVEGATTSAATFARSILPERHVDDAVVFLTRFVPVRSLDLEIAAIRRHAPTVRRAVMQFTRGLELPAQRAFDLVLATGEAVNNAIEHAYPGDSGVVFVRAHARESRVTVEVEDRGRWRAGGSDPDRGRGLWIIDSLADDVHLEHGPTGTLVRMVFESQERALERPHLGREVETVRS